MSEYILVGRSDDNGWITAVPHRGVEVSRELDEMGGTTTLFAVEQLHPGVVTKSGSGAYWISPN